MIARARYPQRVRFRTLITQALLLLQFTRAHTHAEGGNSKHQRVDTHREIENIEDMLPLSDDPEDPIGIDRELEAPRASTTAAGSGKIARPAKAGGDSRFGPEPPPLAAVAGEVLTAPGSVKEHSHQLSVELAAGLASVQEDLEFENSGEKPAEVVYRLAVPKDAALYALEVCNVRGCRVGLPDPSSMRLNAYDDAVQARPTASPPAASAAKAPLTRPATSLLPVADARTANDARGAAIWLRAARVVRGDSLRVRIGYIAQANDHDGTLRVLLPARGMDARAAPTSLRVHSVDHSDIRANDLPVTAAQEAATLDAWSPIELRAHSTSSGVHSEYWSVPCGSQQCVRAYGSASAEPTSATEIFLAIDASPSTEGAARSRLMLAVAALLARAPEGSFVRALRFASETAMLISKRQKARELALSGFAPIAFEAELGAATRFEVAWKAIEQSGFSETRGRKLIVILGDGGITLGPAKPFEAAKRKGVSVAVVNVSDRPSDMALVRGAQLTGGAVIDAGSEADAAARGALPDALEERIAAVFQPSRGALRLPGKQAQLDLRAGDSVVWEAALPNAPALTFGARAFPRSAAPKPLLAAVAAHVAKNSSGKRSIGLVAVERTDLQLRADDRPEGQDEPQKRGVFCDRRGPGKRLSGQSLEDTPVLLAQERAICALPIPKAVAEDKEPELGIGMPGSPLLSMLRQRIIPIARGCFRRDRGGRADYEVRAVFVFELADREVVSATIQGKIAGPLRDCLLTAVDTLAVPRFTGRVVVRYPLVTEKETLPSQIELAPETAKEVDRLTGE